MFNFSIFNRKEILDVFQGVTVSPLDDKLGVKLKFKSCELFIYRDKFTVEIKVLDVDSSAVKNYTVGKVFCQGEFKNLLVDKNNNLVDGHLTEIKGDTVISSLKLKSYLIDVKSFSEDLVVKVFDNTGRRVGHADTKEIAQREQLCC